MAAVNGKESILKKTPRLHPEALSEKTRRVYEALRAIPEISGCLLIGGSALTLHIAHRQSEDLDFLFLREKIDPDAVDAVIRRLQEAGFSAEPILDPIAEMQWEENGLSLRDYHQNWDISGLRVTFFADRVDSLGPGVPDGHIRVLALEALFRTKSWLIMKRHLSRDAFDLYTFFRHDPARIAETVAEAKRGTEFATYERIRTRLLETPYPDFDPGFLTIHPELPTTLEDLRTRLRALFVRFEEQGYR